MANAQHYIGIMSGTSLDGVDAVLADFSNAQPQLLATHHLAFDPALRRELLALNQAGPNELERAALAANQLAQHYAQVVTGLLQPGTIKTNNIAAIGCHGQTVRHRPDLGYTLQLNNPALLAELTGIAVVADFRSRDIAAGGQGAPLVPAFHAAAFQHPSRHRVIVNIGGIANLTNLPCHADILGFDCGPGNLLMDAWCAMHLQLPYDENGVWAASGQVIPALLSTCMQEPYLQQSIPKSTGRDLFNLPWLQTRLRADYAPADVQATLLELTVQTIAQAILTHCSGAQDVLVCGGGGRNLALIHALRLVLAKHGMTLELTDSLNLAVEHVEALAFAWLAHQALQGKAGNLASVTGARHPCVLGAIYPAHPC